MTEDWERKAHHSFLRCMTEHTHVHTCRMRRHIHQPCYCLFPTNWKWKYQLIAFNLRRDAQHLYRETGLRATEDSNRRTGHRHAMHKIIHFPNVNLQMPCNTYQNHSWLFSWIHKLIPTFHSTWKRFRITMTILTTIISKYEDLTRRYNNKTMWLVQGQITKTEKRE